MYSYAILHGQIIKSDLNICDRVQKENMTVWRAMKKTTRKNYFIGKYFISLNIDSHDLIVFEFV